MKRIAASTMIINGEEYHNHVVEIEQGRVVNHYPLTEELPNTEWRIRFTVEEPPSYSPKGEGLVNG